jgi:hypothetical protein
MVQSKHGPPPRKRGKTRSEKVCSWIYSLGISIMMFGYKRLYWEEKRETWIYKYFWES